MLEFNKLRKMEEKSFINWVEKKLRVNVEDLKEKNKIKDYYKCDFKDFIIQLKKNQSITTSLNNIHLKDEIENNFKKSNDKLKRISEQIYATDKLIDDIIYMLYGLKNDEIKVIEKYVGDNR